MEKLIPKLRFPEFKGEWEKKKLGEISNKIGDGLHGTPIYSDDSDIYFINGNNLVNGKIQINENTKKVDLSIFDKNNKGLTTNSLLISLNGTIGNIAKYNNEKVMLGKSVGYFNFNENVDYYYHTLKTDLIQDFFKSELTGSTIKNLSLKTLRETEIPFPSLPEQQKIATFLTSVEGKLQALKKKKSLLEQYKKGVMQNIFSQELRFKDENGNDFPEWEEKTLGEISERKTTKNKEANTNVLTISAQQGLVSQLEYFNKSVSAKDVSGYYLLTKNDFAYNKSYSNGYPMGAIKRLKLYEKGVVSTLYICFKFFDTVNLGFMEQYFESGLHNQEIEKVAQEGARNHGLLNIGLADFFNTNVILPKLEEQTIIANFLTSIDDKINHCGEQIAKMEVWKKGLLQGLFC